MQAARELGLRVPEDLSVIGFDDIEIAGYLNLTTIHQPLFESGYRGINLLLQSMETVDGQAPREELAVDLVIRNTTAPPARSS
jgi:DNA-binding LacI/PurR family transcriptional regulator